MSAWEKEPMPHRIIGKGTAFLLCHHCGERTLKVTGYGADEFARSMKGRLICEQCAEAMSVGDWRPVQISNR